MDIKSLIIKFSWVYILLTTVLAVVLSFVDFKSNLPAYFLLYGIVMFLIQNFVKNNARCLDKKEIGIVFFSFWSVFLLVNTAISLLRYSTMNISFERLLWPMIVGLSTGAILIYLAIKMMNKIPAVKNS
jgi:hypothetical protein